MSNFLRPSTIAYDGLNSIDEIVGKYKAYLSLLSDGELLAEYKERVKEFLVSPTIYNVRLQQTVKRKVFERGLIVGNSIDEESSRQM